MQHSLGLFRNLQQNILSEQAGFSLPKNLGFAARSRKRGLQSIDERPAVAKVRAVGDTRTSKKGIDEETRRELRHYAGDG